MCQGQRLIAQRIVPTAQSLATPYGLVWFNVKGLKGLALHSAMAEGSDLIVHNDEMR